MHHIIGGNAVSFHIIDPEPGAVHGPVKIVQGVNIDMLRIIRQNRGRGTDSGRIHAVKFLLYVHGAGGLLRQNPLHEFRLVRRTLLAQVD